MADFYSDEFHDSYFDKFSEEDFKKVDAAVDAALETQSDAEMQAQDEEYNASFPSEIGGLNLNHLSSQDFAKLDNTTDSDREVEVSSELAGSSFRSDVFSLNLGTLTEGEFEKLDALELQHDVGSTGGPLIEIELEDNSRVGPSANNTSATLIRDFSPIKQFRHKNILSVTDLVSPSWCVFSLYISSLV